MSEHTKRDIASHYCGQDQPHDAHSWHTPPIYGSATVVSDYQCAGLSQAVAPGACWHDSGVNIPTSDVNYRCELKAGHLGAHECQRGNGSAVWPAEVSR